MSARAIAAWSIVGVAILGAAAIYRLATASRAVEVPSRFVEDAGPSLTTMRSDPPAESPSLTDGRSPSRQRPVVDSESPRPKPENPAISRIEKDFPLDGASFSELPLETMSKEEIARIASQIAQYQVAEQEEFFREWGLENLSVISEEEYMSRQMWLFPERMAFPVRRDGVMTGEYCLVTEVECPTVYGLREMVRVLNRTGDYGRELAQKHQEFIEGMQAKFPDSTFVGDAERTVVYCFAADGSILGARRVSTVGNF